MIMIMKNEHKIGISTVIVWHVQFFKRVVNKGHIEVMNKGLKGSSNQL